MLFEGDWRAGGVPRRLAEFGLEGWLRATESSCKHFIGGSGMPRADLGAVLGDSEDFLERAWATDPYEAWGALQQALAKAYGGRPEQYLPTSGASEADAVVALAMLSHKERAVVEKPAYFAILEPARALGAKLSRATWTWDGTAFRLNSARLARGIVRGTRLVSLARPHNPTGARVPDEDLRIIAEKCAKVGAHLLVDEVFAEATALGDTPAARLHPRILSTNSLTKCFGFGPLQVGWVHGEAETVERVRLAKWHMRPLAPVINIVAATEVLAHKDRLLKETRRRRAQNVAAVRGLVERHGLDWSGPGEGATCVVRAPRGDDLAFARRLLRREGVVVAPGSLVELPGWFRIGFLAQPETLEQGLAGVSRQLGGAQ